MCFMIMWTMRYDKRLSRDKRVTRDQRVPRAACPPVQETEVASGSNTGRQAARGTQLSCIESKGACIPLSPVLGGEGQG